MGIRSDRENSTKVQLGPAPTLVLNLQTPVHWCERCKAEAAEEIVAVEDHSSWEWKLKSTNLPQGWQKIGIAGLYLELCGPCAGVAKAAIDEVKERLGL